MVKGGSFVFGQLSQGHMHDFVGLPAYRLLYKSAGASIPATSHMKIRGEFLVRQLGG